jgi:sugar phosphate isomerase/epimerase
MSSRIGIGGGGMMQQDNGLKRGREEREECPSRRSWLLQASAVAAAAPLWGQSSAPAVKRAVKKGRIRQSVAFWCYNATDVKWDIHRLCQVAKAMGVESVELPAPEDYATVRRKYGMACALAHCGMPDPPFVKGLNNPKYHEEVITRTKSSIDTCAQAGIPNVIAFTGYKWRDATDPNSGEIPRVEGAHNCIKALKELGGYAAKRKVTLCLEQLNTRDSSHPMKGHPGYQGDDLDYCADIVRRVGSPAVKLLFDIYHVQVMNGDVIRRIRQYAPLIGHVHAAGSPGRGELDDKQEVNFRGVMLALLETGYKGYVGHEFIPTREPVQGLSEAVSLCDV